MAEDLNGRRAIITGSSKGIGYSIAEAMAGAGMDVVISARDEGEVKEAAERLAAGGRGKATGIPCDVREMSSVRKLIRDGAEALGGLDILVNNAGVGTFAPVGAMSVEKWDQIIETNLSGVFYWLPRGAAAPAQK